MRKISIAIIGLLAFSFLSATALATSGACSYHGGVDCNAGGSLGGYAQCYDGTVSSVLFSAMAECTTSNNCSILDPTGEYQYTSDSQCSALQTEAYREGMQYGGGMGGSWGGTISACENQVIEYQAAETSYQNCLATQETLNSIAPSPLPVICNTQQYQNGNQCLALPANAHANGASGYQCDLGYQNSNEGCVAPLNSFVANGVDLCNAGYIANPYHQCVSATPYQDPALGTYCQQTLGSGSIVQNLGCACAVGYALNSSQTQCVAVPTATSSPNSSPTPTVAAAPTPSLSAQTSFAVNANLQLGSSGANVISLQKFLETKGFLTLPSGTTEGYFGSLTKQALIAYQASVNLPATGYCGPMTRTLINNSSD